MTRISDLSSDLVEEILSRVLVRGAVRSTCKRWNAISKEKDFTMKNYGKAAKEFLLMMTCDTISWSGRTTRFILHGIHNNIKDFSSRKRKRLYYDLSSVKEISTTVSPVDISKIYQCDGLLLLCVTHEYSKLLVWNPYLSQTRWIEASNVLDEAYWYAIGYDNNNNHKVLRFINRHGEILKLEIYDFKSNTWSFLSVTIASCRLSRVCNRGVSLKGNTYFVGLREEKFVICFDFTAEEFGPRLHLPLYTDFTKHMILSCVREKQLAMLHQRKADTYELEIWITTTIEPNVVSWSKFFKVDMEPLAGSRFLSKIDVQSFFIDKEKKVVVVCYSGYMGRSNHRSYVVGEDGNYEEIGLRGNVFSYVPSLVNIQQ